MKAFIFDFDGVIVDSEKYWDKDAYDVYHSIAPSFTREDDAALKGRSIQDIYPMLVRDFGVTMSEQEYRTVITEYADRLYSERTELLAGIRALIDRLQRKSIPIGIASSGELKYIHLILEKYGMMDIFDPIVMAADVGIGKPDPAVYLEAARLMGCTPAECVAYEDSKNGVAAAKAAGMTCIAIRHDWGYEQDLSAADMIVTSHDELTEEILASLHDRSQV